MASEMINKVLAAEKAAVEAVEKANLNAEEVKKSAEAKAAETEAKYRADAAEKAKAMKAQAKAEAEKIRFEINAPAITMITAVTIRGIFDIINASMPSKSLSLMRDAKSSLSIYNISFHCKIYKFIIHFCRTLFNYVNCTNIKLNFTLNVCGCVLYL